MKRFGFRVKARLYRLGFRPRPGSVFYSPSLSLIYAWKDRTG